VISLWSDAEVEPSLASASIELDESSLSTNGNGATSKIIAMEPPPRSQTEETIKSSSPAAAKVAALTGAAIEPSWAPSNISSVAGSLAVLADFLFFATAFGASVPLLFLNSALAMVTGGVTDLAAFVTFS
jgi:hypothetical protein